MRLLSNGGVPESTFGSTHAREHPFARAVSGGPVRRITEPLLVVVAGPTSSIPNGDSDAPNRRLPLPITIGWMVSHELVDQAAGQQGAHQLTAAEHADVPAVLLP